MDICGYELPTNLQNFTQKDLTEVKIFQKVLGGYFFEIPCIHCVLIKVDPYNIVIASKKVSQFK